MTPRRTLLATLLVLPMIGLSLAAPQRAAAAATAGDFLVDMSETAISQLSEKDVSQSKKEEQFKALVGEAFDIPRISKFILGVNWRSASEEQRSAFMNAFEESNMRRFLPFFADYGGEKFEVLKERQDANNPNIYFVSSKINRPEGEPIKVEWRLYEKGRQVQDPGRRGRGRLHGAVPAPGVQLGDPAIGHRRPDLPAPAGRQPAGRPVAQICASVQISASVQTNASAACT